MIERWLVHRVLAGDRNATERLVQEHYPGILRFLGHLTGSRTDAEDLAQQTFLRARDALPQFRHDCSISTWLHKIAYREFTHFLRRRREVSGLPEEILTGETRTDDAVVLAEAIASLPTDLREAFVLREVQRLSVKEVAKILEVPEGTVKSRNHTARERLRDQLAGTWTTRDEEIGGFREPI